MKSFISIDWGTSTFRLRLVHTDLTNIHIQHEILNKTGIASMHQLWTKTKGVTQSQFYIDFLQIQIEKLKYNYHGDLIGLPIISQEWQHLLLG